MPLRILYISATIAESDILKRIPGMKISGEGFSFNGHEIIPLVAGVGSMSTAWEMMKWFQLNGAPGLAINAGIAGSFRDDIQVGDVVIPATDCFADSGIEDGSRFHTLAEAGLSDPDAFPFTSGRIICNNEIFHNVSKHFRTVNAISVNTATGSDISVKKLEEKFNPDIETLEGATFFYICAREKVPFLALRAISNRIERRNRDNWNIPAALENLSLRMKDLFLMLA